MKKYGLIVFPLLFVIIGTFLIIAHVESEDSNMSYFALSYEAYKEAQYTENYAKGLGYAETKADYYQKAMKYYTRALMHAQNSIDNGEKLSRREKFQRTQVIDDSKEQVKICQLQYSEAVSAMNIQGLKDAAYRFMITGFYFASSADTSGAKRNWQEALKLYRQALSLTEDVGERKAINEKIAEINEYKETYLTQ